ncbi:MAG: beta-ketoacyl-[acyl-carrier-protein] synthase family protein [Acidobacteriota bacterium]
MRRHRVAVTGTGVVAPIGSSVAAFETALFSGRSGVGPITLFDPASLPVRIAAEVKERFDAPAPRDRKIGFALEAARQAMAAACLPGSRPLGQGGLSIGLGLEVLAMEDLSAMRSGAPPRPALLSDRLTFLQTPSDLSVPLLCREHGLAAPPRAHVSACAAGTDAVGGAFRAIAQGRSRWMLAGGTDSMIHPLGVAGFAKLGALSTWNGRPEAASRPFDRRRSGFVLGEGAGMLVLERRDDALARGATVLAEIEGYGSSFDAHGISEPHPEGRGAAQAMARALADAGLSSDDVDAVNAHGTGTPKNDPIETLAIRRVFGGRRVPVSATKSMIGHLVSAAGAVEAIAAIACLRAGRLHPTINLDDPDPACDLDHVRGASRPHPVRRILSTSFAFGGQNAAIVIARGEP